MSNDDKTPPGMTNPGAGGGLTAAEREALAKSASDVGARIDAAKHRRDVPKGANTSQGAAMGRGLKISAELIGGVLAGGAVGWALDSWLGTRPLLFILFFLLGTAAGILNIVRQAQREKTPPAPSVPDDADDDK